MVLSFVSCKLRYTHFRWDTYQDVYMIWHHVSFYDFYPFLFA